MILKKGSRGEAVVQLQRYLGLKADGIFGIKTERAVKEFQVKNNLNPDGIVGEETWRALETILTTDIKEKNLNLFVEHHMPKTQYVNQIRYKKYIVLHHTAGWHNPYNTINEWATDSRGRIATEFVIGGQSIDNNTNYDGLILQAFPEGNWAYHLGSVNSKNLHSQSVGIELNSFGELVNRRTYTNRIVSPKQIETLNQAYCGFTQFHKYSAAQIESLKKLLFYISKRDNIDLKDGLVYNIKRHGVAKAFDFSNKAANGDVLGILTHRNVQAGKTDVYPSSDLIDMLMEL